MSNKTMIENIITALWVESGENRRIIYDHVLSLISNQIDKVESLKRGRK